MRAVVCTRYGPPEVLELQEIEKPVPKENEILIRVRAASVNPLDFHILQGRPAIGRIFTGLSKPKNDLLFDPVGNHSPSACRRALSSKGTYVMAGGPLLHLLTGVLLSRFPITGYNFR